MKNIGYSFQGFTNARLKRFLVVGGEKFTFFEAAVNEYGEPTTEWVNTIDILGILHNNNNNNSSYSVVQNDSAGSETRTRSAISIMTSWKALAEGYSGGKELLPGMFTIIDGVIYKIIKTDNLGNFDIAADIYLEEYDGWKH